MLFAHNTFRSVFFSAEGNGKKHEYRQDGLYTRDISIYKK